MKTVTIGDLIHAIGKEPFRKLGVAYKTDPATFHVHAVDILTPVMPKIDALTGQANDPGYMAYVLEYALQKQSAETRK